MDRLLDHYTDAEAAALLAARGTLSPTGLAFRAAHIAGLRTTYGLTSRYDRLRARGLLTLQEAARALGVIPQTVKLWRARGFLLGHPFNDKQECLYELIPGDLPRRCEHKKRRFPSHPMHQVQYEA